MWTSLLLLFLSAVKSYSHCPNCCAPESLRCITIELNNLSQKVFLPWFFRRNMGPQQSSTALSAKLLFIPLVVHDTNLCSFPSFNLRTARLENTQDWISAPNGAQVHYRGAVLLEGQKHWANVLALLVGMMGMRNFSNCTDYDKADLESKVLKVHWPANINRHNFSCKKFLFSLVVTRCHCKEAACPFL